MLPTSSLPIRSIVQGLLTMACLSLLAACGSGSSGDAVGTAADGPGGSQDDGGVDPDERLLACFDNDLFEQCPLESASFMADTACAALGASREQTTDLAEVNGVTGDVCVFYLPATGTPDPASNPSTGTEDDPAQSLTFTLSDRCADERSTEVRFHEVIDGSRTGQVWPGGDRVYLLTGTSEFALACQSGSDVCFGASPRGDSRLFWGVDIDGGQTCTDCCHACGSVPPAINLDC